MIIVMGRFARRPRGAYDMCWFFSQETPYILLYELVRKLVLSRPHHAYLAEIPRKNAIHIIKAHHMLMERLHFVHVTPVSG